MAGRVKKAAPKRKAAGYKMPAPIPAGEIIKDNLFKKEWRIGPSIGVGGFGEIYSACDHTLKTKGSDYPYAIKIEPHENGPLFVEINFYLRNANKDDIAKFMQSKKLSSLGMPTFFGKGSHECNGMTYRYLVMERFGKDVWSLFTEAGKSFQPATVFQLGLQMLDVLEYIHSRGYVHADLKGANMLLGLKKNAKNQVYLVDFGLATRLKEGQAFNPDPKSAHNGTIEYTSRDAHLGEPTMRGDLEILGYNMLQWLTGELPWEKSLKQPKTVQSMKETFMKDVRTNIKNHSSAVPEALIKFFEYINTMKPKEVPDYKKCRKLFEDYLKTEGKTRNSTLDFSSKRTKSPVKGRTRVIAEDSDGSEGEAEVPVKVSKQNGDVPKKRGRKPKVVADVDSENKVPEREKETKKKVKRKSSEPAVLVKVKKTKMNPEATPPAKLNHNNIATQTSIEKRYSPRINTSRHVSFDSPICEIVGDNSRSINSSGDIFDDSFTIKEVKVKPKRKLLSNEEVTVKRVVRKKVTAVKPARSWKDSSTIINGRSPPK
ncbi:hypothetical protein B5X24_HaOG203362 [Helicoverpa armigera]|uniref:non-specific serine/threonine protein kinase n=1 Tax=Helicoverpa armigera TaxID=29058 RepID=A0A2W1BV24_HELAM|nr:hypothetical protein B5X24_HaOG203362 [Helicoverpa armigera]